jgi:hypothetical protein
MLDQDHGCTAHILTGGAARKVRRERRRQARQVALLRVALLHADTGRDICVVRNISSTGLSARIYRKLETGEHVEIEFRSGQLLGGSVIWARDWDVGIAFREPIDVTAVLAGAPAGESGRRRALPRIDVECPGALSTGLRLFEVILQDISQGGASVRMQKPLPELCNVSLSLPDLPGIAGVVRWSSGTSVGISFNECIAFERLARWIHARREDALSA